MLSEQILTVPNLLIALIAFVVILKMLYLLSVWMYNDCGVHDLKVSTHTLRLRLKTDYAMRQLAEEDHKRQTRERRDRAEEVACRLESDRSAESARRDAEAAEQAEHDVARALKAQRKAA